MGKGSYTYPRIHYSSEGLSRETERALSSVVRGIQQLHTEMHDILVPEAWNVPSLLNGWVNYGGGHTDAGYLIDEMGFVHLKGLVKSGILGSGNPVFTLPSGYRPADEELFAVESNNAHGRIDIRNTGNVDVIIGNNVWVSLSGITFLASS